MGHPVIHINITEQDTADLLWHPRTPYNDHSTVCFIIHVPLFQKSNNLIYLDRMKVAAPHFKAISNMKFLSQAFFIWRHKIGAVAHFLRQLKKQKRVPSMSVN